MTGDIIVTIIFADQKGWPETTGDELGRKEQTK
jgi:hypothetical protein